MLGNEQEVDQGEYLIAAMYRYTTADIRYVQIYHCWSTTCTDISLQTYGMYRCIIADVRHVQMYHCRCTAVGNLTTVSLSGQVSALLLIMPISKPSKFLLFCLFYLLIFLFYLIIFYLSLTLFPSSVPVVTKMFSSLHIVITCPKNLDCLHQMSLNHFAVSSAFWRNTLIVFVCSWHSQKPTTECIII